MKRNEDDRIDDKRVTITQDYNRKTRPSHGSGQWTRGQNREGTRAAIMTDL